MAEWVRTAMSEHPSIQNFTIALRLFQLRCEDSKEYFFRLKGILESPDKQQALHMLHVMQLFVESKNFETVKNTPIALYVFLKLLPYVLFCFTIISHVILFTDAALVQNTQNLVYN